MASIIKTRGGFRAQVYVKGVRESASFRTRREASVWASARETELRGQAVLAPSQRHTLGDALRRYGEEVSSGKRGERWEQVRILALLKQLPVDDPVGSITPDVLGKWRDERLRVVSAGTVLRDFGLLAAVFEHARREWRWIAVNPVSDVRKPRAPDHRNTIITRWQIKALVREMGYRWHGEARSVSQSVAVAFLLALRTGMRAGELCGLTWDRVHEDYCVLPVTKTKPRNVPLTRKARRLLDQMRGFDETLVFGLKSQTLDAMFRKYRNRAGLSGFTFHDSRHTAATWLARKLDVLDLCKVFGWSNPKMAMVYYNPSASDIARRME